MDPNAAGTLLPSGMMNNSMNQMNNSMNQMNNSMMNNSMMNQGDQPGQPGQSQDSQMDNGGDNNAASQMGNTQAEPAEEPQPAGKIQFKFSAASKVNRFQTVPTMQFTSKRSEIVDLVFLKPN
jgi:hypothetical protein